MAELSENQHFELGKKYLEGSLSKKSKNKLFQILVLYEYFSVQRLVDRTAQVGSGFYYLLMLAQFLICMLPNLAFNLSK